MSNHFFYCFNISVPKYTSVMLLNRQKTVGDSVNSLKCNYSYFDLTINKAINIVTS